MSNCDQPLLQVTGSLLGPKSSCIPPLWRDLVKIENFDQKAVTYLIFFLLERTDLKNVIFEKKFSASSEVTEVAKVKQP